MTEGEQEQPRPSLPRAWRSLGLATVATATLATLLMIWTAPADAQVDPTVTSPALEITAR